MKTSVVIFFLLLFLAGAAWIVARDPEFISEGNTVTTQLAQKTVSFRTGRSIVVEVADTESARIKGLSGRQSLGDNRGLLFVFETDGYHSMWMKDMNFAIDILWINAEGKIVTIAPSVGPESYPDSFSPTSKARYVLEIPASYTEIYNIKEGDVVDFKL